MYEYIECRRCDSPNCFGCNNATLIEMFHKGKFDCLLDEHNTINPTADVEVVKHGRWERLPDNEEWAYCSQCHCCWEWGIINNCNVRYCPNCGCKMDGVEQIIGEGYNETKVWG